MRVCVTGGRNYNNDVVIFDALDALHDAEPITLLAHGACHYGGADIKAELWAKERQVNYLGIPAQWNLYGKRAGMIRNQTMLDLVKPQLLVAFPGGVGTEGCKTEAEKRGIKVVEYS